MVINVAMSKDGEISKIDVRPGDIEWNNKDFAIFQVETHNDTNCLRKDFDKWSYTQDYTPDWFVRNSDVFIDNFNYQIKEFVDKIPKGNLPGDLVFVEDGPAICESKAGYAISNKMSQSGDCGTSFSMSREGTSISRHLGVSFSGDFGKSITDNRGTSISFEEGESVSGTYGLSFSGKYGKSKSEDSGRSISLYRGSSISGGAGISVTGIYGHAQSGSLGRIEIEYFDRESGRLRVKVGYIGEDGLEPDVLYRLNDEHEFVKVEE
jgi:hypothetical protein